VLRFGLEQGRELGPVNGSVGDEAQAEPQLALL